MVVALSGEGVSTRAPWYSVPPCWFLMFRICGRALSCNSGFCPTYLRVYDNVYVFTLI